MSSAFFPPLYVNNICCIYLIPSLFLFFYFFNIMSFGSQDSLHPPFLLFILQHSSVLKKVDKNNTSNLKASSAAVKKRKRRSIAGLAKVCR